MMTTVVKESMLTCRMAGKFETVRKHVPKIECCIACLGTRYHACFIMMISGRN